RRDDIGPEVEIGIARVVVVLEVIDDRAAIKFAQEHRGNVARMADDEIGYDIGAGLEGVVNAVAVPDEVFKGGAAVIRALGGPAAQSILDALDPIGLARFLARNKGDAMPLACQLGSDHTELSGEILVEEQGVHGGGFSPQRTQRAQSI